MDGGADGRGGPFAPPTVVTGDGESGGRATLPPPSLPFVPAPADDASGRGRLRTRLLVAGAIAATGVVTVAVVVAARGRERGYPSEWDPRVADLVAAVEHDKGEFEHPVEVVFLDDDEFKERLRVDDGLSDEDRAALEQSEAMLRSVGLHGDEGDLLDQLNTLQTEGVAAFYDPDRKEIVIPTSAPDSLAADATLVHELTHARQDQLGQLDDDVTPEDEEGRRALVEGEADFIEHEWIEGLSDEERDELEQEQGEQFGDATMGVQGVDPALVASFAAPYAFGGPMVAAIHDTGPVADAFDAPARSSGDVFNPVRWLDPVAPVEVDAPSLGVEEVALGDDGPFGAYSVYMMLATVLEPRDALAAADGWGGDRMQVYRTIDDQTCVRIHLVGVDEAATTRLADAFATWAASRPNIAAGSALRNGRVELDTCDVGAAANSVTSEVAMLPAARASLVPVLLDEGVHAWAATCMSREFVAHVPPDLLWVDVLTDDQQELVTSTWADASVTCVE